VNLEPLYDRILVRPLDGATRTKGGLYVPQIAHDNTPWQRAEVVAVGHGRLTPDGTVVPLRVRVGDVVAFFRSAGSGEQLVFPGDGGEDLLVIREPNVLAIYRDLPRATGLLNPDGTEAVMQ
jgi:chaperonin GroES